MASDSESSPEPAAKKAKTEAEKNEKGETFFKLSTKRRLTVLQFKGTTYVDIREMYGDNNDKPGKKGIMLPMEQFEKAKELITSGEIDEAIKDLEKE